MGQVVALFPEVAADRLDARDYNLPPRIVSMLERYVFERKSPGSFLTSVLCNDLQMAVTYADSESLAYIKPICQFIFNRVPSVVWGSTEAVELHLRQGSLTQQEIT